MDLMVRRNSNPVGEVLEAIYDAAEKLDSGKVAVIATDNAGTILYWNAEAERLYGWRATDALDRNVVDVTRGQQSPEDAERIMRELVAGKTWTGTFIVTHKDGTPVPVHVSDVPVIVDGAVAGIVGVSRRL